MIKNIVRVSKLILRHVLQGCMCLVTVGSVVVEGRVVVGSGGGRKKGCHWAGLRRGVESGARLDVSVNRFSKVRFISPRKRRQRLDRRNMRTGTYVIYEKRPVEVHSRTTAVHERFLCHMRLHAVLINTNTIYIH